MKTYWKQTRSVAFPSMDDSHPQVPESFQNFRNRIDRFSGQADVIPHGGHVAVRPAEVGLHVDHQKS